MVNCQHAEYNLWVIGSLKLTWLTGKMWFVGLILTFFLDLQNVNFTIYIFWKTLRESSIAFAMFWYFSSPFFPQVFVLLESGSHQKCTVNDTYLFLFFIVGCGLLLDSPSRMIWNFTGEDASRLAAITDIYFLFHGEEALFWIPPTA